MDLENVLVVILTGGKGSRLRHLDDSIPKSLFKVNGITILENQLKCIEKCSFKEVLVITGHGHVQISQFLNSYKTNLKISVLEDKRLSGTLPAINLLANYKRKNFILIYGDLIFDLNLKAILNFHNFHKSDVTALVHNSSHIEDSDSIKLNNSDRVTAIYNKGEKIKRETTLTLAGIYCISPGILNQIPKDINGDFVKNFLNEGVKYNKLKVYGFKNYSFCKDIGTPQRLLWTNRLQKKDMVGGWHNSRPFVFLDRDGTINHDFEKEVDFSLFKFQPCALKAIKKISTLGYGIVIVTNQPGIAKGYLTRSQLELIHSKMLLEISHNGGKIDEILYCPHHPDKGYKGEIKYLKKQCKCRKPNSALVDKFRKEVNINVEKSWVVGDSWRDDKLAEKIGMRFAGIGAKNFSHSINVERKVFETLLDFANYLTKMMRQN